MLVNYKITMFLLRKDDTRQMPALDVKPFCGTPCAAAEVSASSQGKEQQGSAVELCRAHFFQQPKQKRNIQEVIEIVRVKIFAALIHEHCPSPAKKYMMDKADEMYSTFISQLTPRQQKLINDEYQDAKKHAYEPVKNVKYITKGIIKHIIGLTNDFMNYFVAHLTLTLGRDFNWSELTTDDHRIKCIDTYPDVFFKPQRKTIPEQNMLGTHTTSALTA